MAGLCEIVHSTLSRNLAPTLGAVERIVPTVLVALRYSPAPARPSLAPIGPKSYRAWHGKQHDAVKETCKNSSSTPSSMKHHGTPYQTPPACRIRTTPLRITPRPSAAAHSLRVTACRAFHNARDRQALRHSYDSGEIAAEEASTSIPKTLRHEEFWKAIHKQARGATPKEESPPRRSRMEEEKKLHDQSESTKEDGAEGVLGLLIVCAGFFFGSLGIVTGACGFCERVWRDTGLADAFDRLHDDVHRCIFGTTWTAYRDYRDACRNVKDGVARPDDHRIIADYKKLKSENKFFGDSTVTSTNSSLPGPTEELQSEYWKKQYQALQAQINKQNGTSTIVRAQEGHGQRGAYSNAHQIFLASVPSSGQISKQNEAAVKSVGEEIPVQSKMSQEPPAMSESAKLRAETRNLTPLELWQKMYKAEEELKRPEYIEKLEIANKKLGRPNNSNYDRMKTLDIWHKAYQAEEELRRPEYLRKLAKARGIKYVEEGEEDTK